MPALPAEEFGRDSSPDSRLADALNPSITTAFKRSVREDPQAWADSIFPTLIPAIRMAVAGALRGMVQTLNQVLEHSLSSRSWRWKIEAWRTGKTFAEVVLARTLIYRVDQVLLVHRNSGLLIASASSSGATQKDADQISAMLIALQDFVHEAFQVSKGAGIHELHIAEFTLLVEQGPYAALAVAVYGNPPAELRETLRAAVDLAHQEYGSGLRDYGGDRTSLESCRTILEGCLQSQYQEPRKTSYRKLWFCSTVLAVLILAWVLHSFLEAHRWERALTALRVSPGILITRAERERGRYVVEGLRDPLSIAPNAILATVGMDTGRAEFRFRPFLSLEAGLLAKRALAITQAPETVSATVHGDLLVLAGTAPHDWIIQVSSFCRQLSPFGIRNIRTSALWDRDLQFLRKDVESRRILFATGSSALTPAQATSARKLASDAARWVDYASAIGLRPRVEVLGSSDSSGTGVRNAALSRDRAARLTRLLVDAGIAPDRIERAQPPQPAPDNLAFDMTLQRNAALKLSFFNGEEPAERAR